MTASDHHSINADNSDDRSSYGGSTECLIKIVSERGHDTEASTSYPDNDGREAHAWNFVMRVRRRNWEISVVFIEFCVGCVCV